MKIVGIPEPEREAVLRTVAAVLHLGNVAFAPGPDGEGAAPADSSSVAALDTVADLLQVSKNCCCAGLPTALSSSRSRTWVTCMHRVLWRPCCTWAMSPSATGPTARAPRPPTPPRSPRWTPSPTCCR